jgi:hypothetical protein
MIENLLGFPNGISGSELATRAVVQARRFGAELLLARPLAGRRHCAIPGDWRKTPLTGTSPHTLVLFSRTSDLEPSYRVQLANRRPPSSDP